MLHDYLFPDVCGDFNFLSVIFLYILGTAKLFQQSVCLSKVMVGMINAKNKKIAVLINRKKEEEC